MANSSLSPVVVSIDVTSSTTTGSQPVPPVFAVVVISFLIAITILSNLLVILAFLTNRLLRSPFNLYLLNLSSADFLVGVVDMPYYASYTRAGGNWVLSSTHCSIWVFFDYFATGISLWTLAVISFDRVWAVTWAISYRKYNRISKSFALLGFARSLTFCATLPGYVKTRSFNPVSANDTSTANTEGCNWDVEGLPSWAASINVVTVNNWVPFVLTIFCYVVTVTRIIQARRVRSRVVSGIPPVRTAPTASTRSTRNEKKEKQAFILLTLLICAIIACWTPWYLYFIWNVATSLWNETGSEVTYWLAYSLSAVNPFLFNVANNDIRLAIQQLLGCAPKNSRKRPGHGVSHFSTVQMNDLSVHPQ